MFSHQTEQISTKIRLAAVLITPSIVTAHLTHTATSSMVGLGDMSRPHSCRVFSATKTTTKQINVTLKKKKKKIFTLTCILLLLLLLLLLYFLQKHVFREPIPLLGSRTNVIITVCDVSSPRQQFHFLTWGLCLL